MKLYSDRQRNRPRVVSAMSLWRGETPLILASQSSARKTLLANAGLEFKAITADIDERGIQAASKLSGPHESPCFWRVRRPRRSRPVIRGAM